MDVAMTKMSSRGQVVIPEAMRENISEGEKLIVIQNKNQIILQKVTMMDKKFKEDIDFARKTDEARKRIESGKCVTMDFDDFIKEMKKW